MKNMSLLSAKICGPKNVVKTVDLLNALEDKLSPDFNQSLQRMGIDQRYSVINDYPRYLSGKSPRQMITSTTSLATEVIQHCIFEKEVDPKKIGLLIAITNTPDRPLPCLSYEIVSRLGNLVSHEINTINMQNQGCSAFLKAIEIAKYYLQANPNKLVAIVAAEAHTAFAEAALKEKYFSLREIRDQLLTKEQLMGTKRLLASFLFGDAAVAMIFSNQENPSIDFGPFVHFTNLEQNDTELLTLNQGGTLMPIYEGYPFYSMSRHVPERGAVYVENCIRSLMAKDPDFLAAIDQADHYFVHTGSKKILDGIFKTIGIPAEDIRTQLSYEVLKEYANISPCSTAFMLTNAFNHGFKGKSLVVSFGVGFSASASFIRFN